MTTLENKDLNTNLENTNTTLEDQKLNPENFGSYLKQKRNEKGESLEDVNKAIRINTRVLKAFEQNQFTNIEDFDNVYLRMYLKKYTSHLGIDDYSLIDKQIYEDTAKQVNRASKLVRDSEVSHKSKPSAFTISADMNRKPSGIRKVFFLLVTLVIIIAIGVIVVKSVFTNEVAVTAPTPVQEPVTQVETPPVEVPEPAPVVEEPQTPPEEVAPAAPTSVTAPDGEQIPLEGVYVKLKAASWVGTKVNANAQGWGELRIPLNTLTQIPDNIAVLRFGNIKGVSYLYINGVAQDLSSNTNIKSFTLR